jgi:hypothetical protein
LKRKLIVLNLVLLAAAAALALHVREAWRKEQAREQAVLLRRTKPAPPPQLAPLPKAAPVKAASYIDIAQKMLFSKDRNPTVVIEPPAAPPPKPMPPLPVFHGVLDIGDGITAILSEKPGGPHHDFRPGDQIGEFKLVSVDAQQIVLEWEGQTITKDVEELLDRSTPPPSPQPPPNVAAAAKRPAAAAPPAPHGQPAPGIDLGGRGIRACQPGDTSPPGTVADGMRKVIKNTPFGQHCYWEPAGGG